MSNVVALVVTTFSLILSYRCYDRDVLSAKQHLEEGYCLGKDTKSGSLPNVCYETIWEGLTTGGRGKPLSLVVICPTAEQLFFLLYCKAYNICDLKV